MEPISSNSTFNIGQKLPSKSVVGDAVITAPEISTDALSAQPSVEVHLSPAATSIVELNFKERFSSNAEFSAHATKLHQEWITLEEMETGKRRPFASPEDERLSHLTLKQLMEEEMKLPMIDEHGYSQLSANSTERGDRINVALANILLKTQFDFKKAGESVVNSLHDFKESVNKKLGVDQSSYDVVFKKGKPTVVAKISSTGKAANPAEIEKIQKMLDSPNIDTSVKKLTDDIASYNNLSWNMIDNDLTQHIYGAEQNPYLSKNVSKDWLMEGTNYADVETTNNLHDRYIDIVAEANVKYYAALEDGSHFKHKINPFILEVSPTMEEINIKV